MSDTKYVEYLGNNSNSNNTAAISFPGENRADIPVGGRGYLTDEEIATARRFGLVVNQVTNADELDSDALKTELDGLGIEYKGSAAKKDLAKLVEDGREALRVDSTSGDTPTQGEAGDSVDSATAAGSTTSGVAGNGGAGAIGGSAS